MVLRQAVNLAARGAGIRPRDHANEACAGCAPSRRTYLRARTPRPTSWRPRCCARERIERPWLSGRISCEWASSAERLEIAAPGGARWISAGFHVRPSPAAHSSTREINSEPHPAGSQMAPGGPSRVVGRCEAACLHFPTTPLAGNSHDDRREVCGRDSNPPTHPLPPLARMY